MLRQVSGEQADGRDGRRTGESRNRAGDGRDRKPVPPRGTDYFPCREPGSALWPVDRCGRTELLPVLSLKTPPWASSVRQGSACTWGTHSGRPREGEEPPAGEPGCQPSPGDEAPHSSRLRADGEGAQARPAQTANP